MISSLITLRLKRRSALSIDSFELIDIYAIYRLTSFRPKISPFGQTLIKQFFDSYRKPKARMRKVPDQARNSARASFLARERTVLVESRAFLTAFLSICGLQNTARSSMKAAAR